MKLKVTLVDRSGPGAPGDHDGDDLLVTVDATTTMGQLARHLAASHPRRRADAPPPEELTLTVHPGTVAERIADPLTTMADAGVRSGDRIALARRPAAPTGPLVPVATLTVLDGPDAGRSFPLPAGTSIVGRDASCDVRLSDPLVSKRHARIHVTDMVELVDEQSANGIVVAGEVVQRVALTPGVDALLGETRVVVALHAASGAGSAAAGHAIEFNRSPRVDPRYAGVELVAPEPPQRPQPQRFPIVTVIAPILMGAILYAVTKNALSMLFVGLSPIMAIGSFYENRWATARASTQNAAAYRAAVRDFAVQLHYAADIERARRRAEHPSIGEVVGAVQELGPLVWTRRPEHASFTDVRLGLGRVASRNTVRLPTSNNTVPELWRELHDVVGEFATVDRVPVVASPDECGGIGVAGPAAVAHPLAAALMAQFAALHSPAELVIACIAGPSSAMRWEWLKWLPHVGSEHSPLATEHLCTTRPAVTSLIAALGGLISERTGATGAAATGLPRVVVVVQDDAATDRARLVQIAERGRSAGICVVWVAASLERVPAACRAYLEVDPNSGQGRAGFVHSGVLVDQLELEPLDDVTARLVARRLAPLVDAGALLEDASDLPRAVSLLDLTGHALATSPDDVLQRWAASNSLPAPAGAAPRLKRDNHLRALVGQTAVDRLHLDLRAHGPHALVGGTTGAGKSEFLQSWIIGMATAHSPARVNFLLVDYKGGAAFADCVDLPHTVGLVTDLTPHLVRRALRSLNAELRRREHVLNRKRAKDLLELERRRDPDAPPSLVIVVDEFAALVSEVPEFVDGVVNVAQRGRSLGLHLVLATQRPAGVIRGNLRANTNLRVALRMADEVDSEDVIGTRAAAAFDPSTPGRAIAKSGPGQMIAFQSVYVGGHSDAAPLLPPIDVVELGFGAGVAWELPPPDVEPLDTATGPTDIHRIVANVAAAAERIGLPPPTRPWLPELAPTYRLEDLPTARTDRELVFGVLDLPDSQSQPAVSFVPDRDGNMAVFGTGGSGKSTFLRTIAAAAGFAPARGGPVTVYGIDFGARGLHMLEPLPHVGAVIGGDDNERLVRLVRQLRATIDDRAVRYAAVSASTIEEYRERTGQRQEARILVLLDGFGGFRQAYEIGPQSRIFETFLSIAADGRSTGVHVIVTADRPASVPASLSSSIQKRLVLRLANELDYVLVGVASDALSASSPPGRGFLDGHEVHVGILGGDPNVARQTVAFEHLSAAMARAGVAPVDRITSLPDRVLASELPADVGGLPVLGVWDETMAAVGFDPTGTFLISGPPQSGKTTAVASMLAAIARVRPQTPFALFGQRRSSLEAMATWSHRASTPEAMETLANELTAAVSAEDPAVAGLVVVIESVADLLNTAADMPLQHLVKACRASDGFVIAEGESSTLGSSWALVQAVKANRTGLALQPDQMEGDSIFRTPFPRMQRSEFPPGRGLLVRSGAIRRVQVALPE